MLTTYAKIIREKYTVVITSTLVLGILVGLLTPAPGLAIRKISTFLIVIMLGAMGFTITFKSLGAAAKDWKSFILGLALNFAFAPLLCWLLALLFLSSHPDLPIAVGIAVVSFKGLVMFPIAVAFSFQMLTAVSFYQIFLRSLPAGSPQAP